jgi:DNA-binding beta-propeller fold protein YncE
VLRALIAALAALALMPGGASALPSGGAEEAYVAIEEADLVVSVMLDAGEITSRIRVPDPRYVAVGTERRLILVSSPRAGRVTAIDSFRRRKIGSFGGLGSPRGVAIVGRYAYVADAARGELVVLDLDLESWRIAGRVHVGGRPHDVAVGKLGVIADERDGRLTLLDVSRPAAPRVLGRLNGGNARLEVAVRPRTASAYVADGGSGTVAALDAGRKTVRWKRRVGSSLQDLTYGYRDQLWVTDAGLGTVVALRASDGRVLRRLRRCPGARGVHFGPGRGHIVAACHDAGTLLVLDPVSESSRRVRIGGRPDGVAVAFVP